MCWYMNISLTSHFYFLFYTSTPEGDARRNMFLCSPSVHSPIHESVRGYVLAVSIWLNLVTMFILKPLTDFHQMWHKYVYACKKWTDYIFCSEGESSQGQTNCQTSLKISPKYLVTLITSEPFFFFTNLVSTINSLDLGSGVQWSKITGLNQSLYKHLR